MKAAEQLIGNVSHWWQQLAEGWQHLRLRAERAITRFAPVRDADSDYPLVGEWTWAVLAADVREDDECITVQLEVPGLDESDIDVRVTGNALRISGEKRHEKSGKRGRYHVVERAFGRFERVVPLAVDVDANDARARYRQGVLTVTLPKRSGVGQRVRVPVKSV